MPPRLEIAPADRAALERMAKGRRRAAFRARAVLALADGGSVAATARRVRITEKTVRAARANFLSGGVDALRDKPRGGIPEFPELRVSPPPELANWREGGARGRPPHARRKIETWVRDCAALGLLRPGARLPDREWFCREFSATPGLVQAAFSELARQGFVRPVQNVATYLPRRLPFAGRYLLGVLPIRDDENREGLDTSLIAAARRQEKRLGVKWDVCDIVPPSHPDYLPTLFRIASQRYAGVFLRVPTRKKYNPGRHRWFASVDHVPICSMGPRSGSSDGGFGSHFHFIAIPSVSSLETLFAAVRAAGCRRALVLGAQNEPVASAAAEDEALAAAAKAGVEVPRGFYQCVNLLAPLQTRRLLELALSHQDAAGLDSVVCLQDNYAPIVCEGLVARFGGAQAASRRFKVFSLGSFPGELRCLLPVEWHGDDWDATLDSFVRWCDAIHAGVDDPPPPSIVRR